MTKNAATKNPKRPGLHRWIRRGFLLWAFLSTLWLANSYRTRGVPEEMLRSGQAISMVNNAATLEFLPASPDGKPALIFLCGAGVSARAYVPLLRPIAEVGHAVFIVKLPYRFAPLESHKLAALDRARNVIAAHPGIAHWVVSGHSLGGALACRVVQAGPKAISAMVLIGTTHPKQDDLSGLQLPITKVYASLDKVAPLARIRANKKLLPPQTKWVEIDGGNHSQFGHYGHQLLDGRATITRESQQTLTRAALLEALTEINE